METLPDEIDPELDFRNYEDVSENLLEEPALEGSDHVALETDGIEEPELVSDSIPSDLNDVLPSNPPIQFSRRGRRIIPPRSL